MLRIERFQSKHEAAWDRFVLEESVNGTFLQTRNFLNYHPPGRFSDCSLLAMDNGIIFAAIPACEIKENAKKCFFSHKGSTYGGLIVGKPFYNTAFINDLLIQLEDYWRENQYHRVLLKLTSNLLCSESSDLLEYMLRLYKFDEYAELSTFIDFYNYSEPVISNFNQNKRKVIRNIDSRYAFRPIITDHECEDFYSLLCANLEKHNAKPIHSLCEILDFKNIRLKEDVKFYGVFLDELQLAGGMLFDFHRQKTIHAQNLSINPKDNHLNAMPFLYYSLIKHYKEQGYRYLSWGISTEEQGQKLNFSLIRNKESYGSKYSVNRTFYKNY